MHKDLEILIDWLQFTSHKLTVIDIIEVLGLKPEDFVEVEKGMMGYKSQIIAADGGVKILSDGKPDMGIHTIISGTGCRYIETIQELIPMIHTLIHLECKFTRIDLAADDRKGLVKMSKLKKYLNNGWCVSRFKTFDILEKRKLSDGQIIGQTIYFGNRQSRIFLRIYDKAKQMKVKGSWIRIEIEVKKERADALVKLLEIEKTGKIFSGILNNYIRILEPCKDDTNKSRWKTEKDWQKLVESVDKLSLTTAPELKDICDVKKWIEKQVSTSLALLMVYYEGDTAYLNSVINKGYEKLKPKHFAKLKAS